MAFLAQHALSELRALFGQGHGGLRDWLAVHDEKIKSELRTIAPIQSRRYDFAVETLTRPEGVHSV